MPRPAGASSRIEAHPAAPGGCLAELGPSPAGRPGKSPLRRRRRVCYSDVVITGVQVSETLQLVFVLIVLACTIGGIYLMQRYTGV